MESVDDGSQMRVSATGGLSEGFTYDQTAAEATRLDGGDAEFDILEGGSFDEGAPAGGGGGGAGAGKGKVRTPRSVGVRYPYRTATKELCNSAELRLWE